MLTCCTSDAFSGAAAPPAAAVPNLRALLCLAARRPREHAGSGGDHPEPDQQRHGPQDREQPLPGLHVHFLPGARHQGVLLGVSARGCECACLPVRGWWRGCWLCTQITMVVLCSLSRTSEGSFGAESIGQSRALTDGEYGNSRSCWQAAHSSSSGEAVHSSAFTTHACAPATDLAWQHRAPRTGLWR